MAKMIVDTEMKVVPDVVPGTLMIHEDLPPYIVMATSIVIGDEFAGVSLSDGVYGEQWVISEYSVFQGKLSLEQ
jgi:hypothetical protein